MQGKIKSFYLLLIIAACMQFGNEATAQGRLGYFIGGGLMLYNGDLTEKSLNPLAATKIYKPFIRAGINYVIVPKFEASLSFMYGHVEGADSLATEKDNIIRNQSFKSVIEELSLTFEYHLFTYGHWTPFVFAGAGIFHFNPTAELDGIRFELQPIGTEGQNINSGSNIYPAPYKLTQLSLPVGIGVYYRINESWMLRLDYANHFTFTDYIDDVSQIYPDSAALAKAPNGQLAVMLSNRRLDTLYPDEKRSRGNPKYNDGFAHIGLAVSFYPGRGNGKAHGQGTNSKSFKRKSLNCPGFGS
jgi:hypothetical protein